MFKTESTPIQCLLRGTFSTKHLLQPLFWAEKMTENQGDLSFRNEQRTWSGSLSDWNLESVLSISLLLSAWAQMVKTLQLTLSNG